MYVLLEGLRSSGHRRWKEKSRGLEGEVSRWTLGWRRVS